MIKKFQGLTFFVYKYSPLEARPADGSNTFKFSDIRRMDSGWITGILKTPKNCAMSESLSHAKSCQKHSSTFYLILLNLRGGVGLNLKIRGYTRINYQEFSIDPKYYR